MKKERKTEMGMNKREYQQKIDELENLLKIYQDHLRFEKSKSEGFKADYQGLCRTNRRRK